MAAASITVHRALEWIDTDAAGIWHFTTALRYLEHAEFELLRTLGVHDQVFGRAPRVRLEIDYLAPVRFADEVATTLTVAEVGRTSIRYHLLIDGPQGRVVEGTMVCVFLGEDGRSRPLDERLRTALTTGGPLSPTPGGPSGT